MSVARDGYGYALKLYVGEWHWRPENRFCPRGSCTEPDEFQGESEGP